VGSRLQARRDDAERRALFRLTVSYVGVFAVVIAALSLVAYAAIENTYRSIVAPALETSEGRAGLSAAMRPALFSIVSVDVMLLMIVGVASFALARAALRPMALAREREERFSADVAHELRTPIAAIASLAEAGSSGNLPSAHGSLRAIARRALECGDLISALLTLARASEPDALEREPVDVAMLARRACAERPPRERDVRVECATEHAIVLGDERRLLQLVRNLLDNACEHARTNVIVTIGAERDGVVLTVEDDGLGVDPALKDRLFERFAKSDSSRGSGLGLAICRWVSRAHGGDVVYAGGSKFIVRLPADGSTPV